MVEVNAINKANHDFCDSVITLFTELKQFNTFESLGVHFLQFAQNLGYDCCLQIRTSDQKINLSYRGALTDLEQKVLDYLNLKDRFIPFGQRLVVNLPSVSALLTNLPETEDDISAAQDNLTQLLQVAECSISNLTSKLEDNHSLRRRVNHVTTETEELLTHINHHFREHKARSQNIMNDIICRIEMTLAALDLDEAQEQQILELVTEAGNRLDDILDDSAIIESELQRLLEEEGHILDGTTD